MPINIKDNIMTKKQLNKLLGPYPDGMEIGIKLSKLPAAGYEYTSFMQFGIYDEPVFKGYRESYDIDAPIAPQSAEPETIIQILVL